MVLRNIIFSTRKCICAGAFLCTKYLGRRQSLACENYFYIELSSSIAYHQPSVILCQSSYVVERNEIAYLSRPSSHLHPGGNGGFACQSPCELSPYIPVRPLAGFGAMLGPFMASRGPSLWTPVTDSKQNNRKWHTYWGDMRSGSSIIVINTLENIVQYRCIRVHVISHNPL